MKANLLYKPIFLLLFLSLFSHQSEALNLTSSSPTANFTRASASTDIILNFDSAVVASTVNSNNFKIYGSQTGFIQGVFSGGGSSTITFNPTTDFKEGEVITVSIGNGLLQLVSNSAVRNHTFQFTVAASVNCYFQNTTPQPNRLGNNLFNGTTNYATDLDGDGDMDLLVSSSNTSASASDLVWFQNNGSQGFSRFNINSTALLRATSIFAADINGDGHMDVLSSSHSDHKIAWFENNGSQVFTEHIISTIETNAHFVSATDMDSDGDIDIISASAGNNTLAWFENKGAQGFTRHVVDNAALDVRFVQAIDMDRDGDMDLVSASPGDNRISWYENSQQNFTKRIISSQFIGVTGVPFAIDADGDGDVDVIASAQGGLRLFENDGNQGFTAKIIASGIPSAESLSAADLDGDGDVDILSASAESNNFYWYENNGSQVYTTHILHQFLNPIRSTANWIQPTDMDGDGDLDITSLTFNTGELYWYENVGTQTQGPVSFVSASPVANSTRVAADANIVLNFSDTLPSCGVNSNNIKIYGSQTGFISGVFSRSGSSFTFDPTSNFKAGEVITVTVTSDIAPPGLFQVSGNPSSNSYTFQFTVAASLNCYFRNASPHPNLVDNNLVQGTTNYATDMDGDGDLDLLVSRSNTSPASDLVWFQNNGSQGFTRFTISSNAFRATSIFAADINGDGHMDVLSSSHDDHKIAWYENNGSQVFNQGNFTQHTISTTETNASFVYAADVDSDGDIDVISTSIGNNTLAWFENKGALGFTRHVVDNGAMNVSSVQAIDLDKDGDMDLVSASPGDNRISWYENNQQNFTKRTIGFGLSGLSVNAFAIDADGDSDVDVIASVNGALRLFENDGNQVFTPKIIAAGVSAKSVSAADLDGDGDVDILSASLVTDKFNWYENNGSQVYTKHLLHNIRTTSQNHSAALWIHPTDIDGDGDLDVSTLTSNGGLLHWYENVGTQRPVSLVSSSPMANSTRIAANANIVLTFSDTLPSCGVNSNNIKIYGNRTGLISGVFSGSGGSFTFNPASNFKPGELITVTITSGIAPGFFQGSGNSSSNSHAFQFTVASVLNNFYASNSAAEKVVQSQVPINSIFPADMDGDGDMDVLSASNDSLYWMINDGVENFSSRSLLKVSSAIRSVHAADVDGDGDMDVVYGRTDALNWEENLGGQGFTHHIIKSSVNWINSVYPVDLDKDGDLDIVASIFFDNKVVWYENNGSQVFTEKTIATNLTEANSVYAADIDKDGDLDIVVGATRDNTINWLENDGNQAFTNHILGVNALAVNSVYALDVDKDGDMDVLSASINDNTIAWYENNGSQSFTKRIISTNAVNARSVFADDIDGDGDIDVLSASAGDHKIAYYINNGSQVFTERIISTAINGPGVITAVDMNRDGDLDILVASNLFSSANSSGSNKVSWFENQGPNINLISTSPLPNAINQANNAPIIFTFDTINLPNLSNAVHTSNIKISGSQSGAISGNFSVNQNKLSFVPTSNYKPGELISVTITKDFANFSDRGHSFQFSVSSGANPYFRFTDQAAFQNFTNSPAQRHGTLQRNLIGADVNSDGDIDLFTLNGSALYLMENLGNKSFNEHVIHPNISASVPPYVDAKAGDMDNDGDLDIVVAVGNDSIYIFSNNGGGSSFTSQTIASGGVGFNFLSLTDIDNDGDKDIVILGLTQIPQEGLLVWYENKGKLGFTRHSIDSGLLFSLSTVRLKDLDADGDMDILATNGNNILWYENQPGNNFIKHILYPASGQGPTGFVLEGLWLDDLDADGDLDIIGMTLSSLLILQNSGTSIPIFSSQVLSSSLTYSFSTGLIRGQIRCADMDGDGDLDILTNASTTQTQQSSRHVWYENRGNLNFSAHDFNPNNDRVAIFEPLDLDNDGDLDYAFAIDLTNQNSPIATNIYWIENENIDIINNGTVWTGGSGINNALGTGDGTRTTLIQGNVNLSHSGTTNRLFIDKGATLTINPGVCIKVNTEIVNNGALILDANATQSAQYFGPSVRATVRQLINNPGWHNIGSPFSNATWDSISINNGGHLKHPVSGTSQLSCNTCNLWYYDTSSDSINIGTGGTTAHGIWRSSANGGEAFTADKGWTLYLDNTSFGTAPWTISGTAMLRSSEPTQMVNENNGGWNLVANPFPSSIDWDVVAGKLSAAGIRNSYHIWDPVNTTYVSYSKPSGSSGTGTLGATRYLNPFQGFWVQTSITKNRRGGNVMRNFALQTADRPTSCPGGGNRFFKQANTENKIVLRTKVPASGKQDETVLVFGPNFQDGFFLEEDVVKRRSDYLDVASIYSTKGNRELVINRLPEAKTKGSVELGIVAFEGEKVELSATTLPQAWIVYIEDKLYPGQNWHRLDHSKFVFHQQGDYPDRFVLHFIPKTELTIGLGENELEKESNYLIYYEDHQALINTQEAMNWTLYSASGQILGEGMFGEGRHVIPNQGLSKGVYILSLQSNRTGKVQNEKIVISN